MKEIGGPSQQRFLSSILSDSCETNSKPSSSFIEIYRSIRRKETLLFCRKKGSDYKHPISFPIDHRARAKRKNSYSETAEEKLSKKRIQLYIGFIQQSDELWNGFYLVCFKEGEFQTDFQRILDEIAFDSRFKLCSGLSSFIKDCFLVFIS